MPIDDQIGSAITAGPAFLAGNQLDSGEFPVVTCERSDRQGTLTPAPSIFPTALAANSLGLAPGAEDLVAHAITFLRGQRDEYGLWPHWIRDNPMFRPLPPDLDDTFCVSAVLAQHKISGTVDPALVIANRGDRGLFYTWVVPRLRWSTPGLRRVMLRQLRHLLVIRGFFRMTSAELDGVDAVVNANCLFAMGAFRGHRAVVDYLLDILRDGRETTCDKWYDSPFVVRYAFSKSLRPIAPEDEDIVVPRLLSAEPADALEPALLVSSLLDWGRVAAEATVRTLFAEQQEDGNWPLLAFCHRGRRRWPDGRIDDPFPYWGSTALTTAFALEALARWQQARCAA